MRVTMSIQIGGYRNGEPWPAPGNTIDVPEAEAHDLIANHYAEATDDQAPAADNDPAADDDPAADAEPDAAPVADDDPAADAEPVKPAKRTKS